MEETSIYLPTPRTPSKQQLTRDDRLRISTLYYDAGFTQDDIVLQTGYTRNQVQWALSHRLTPQKYTRGRKALLNTPQRKRLIEWVTASSINRRTQWKDIPPILGLDCGEKAIRAAFKKEGFVRRHARRKPPLSEQHQKDRLDWAWEHIFWTEEQWFEVLWSDETWVNPGSHTRAWITRRIRAEEVYHVDCVEARY
jgi:transposase